MRLHRIRAHADHDGALLLDLIDSVAERTCFLRAAWCVILRIKVQNHLLALEIRELYFIPRVVHYGEVGRFLPDLEIAAGWFRHEHLLVRI